MYAMFNKSNFSYLTSRREQCRNAAMNEIKLRATSDSVHGTEALAASVRSMLDCTLAQAAGRRKRFVLLTIGNDDGSIEPIALPIADGHRLLAAVALALRPDRRPQNPPYGTARWLNRHSVLRAESKIEGDEAGVYERLKRDLPDVADFLAEEMAALQKILRRSGRSAAKPQTVVERVRRMVLVAVDATRGDT